MNSIILALALLGGSRVAAQPCGEYRGDTLGECTPFDICSSPACNGWGDQAPDIFCRCEYDPCPSCGNLCNDEECPPFCCDDEPPQPTCKLFVPDENWRRQLFPALLEADSDGRRKLCTTVRDVIHHEAGARELLELVDAGSLRNSLEVMQGYCSGKGASATTRRLEGDQKCTPNSENTCGVAQAPDFIVGGGRKLPEQGGCGEESCCCPDGELVFPKRRLQGRPDFISCLDGDCEGPGPIFDICKKPIGPAPASLQSRRLRGDSSGPVPARKSRREMLFGYLKSTGDAIRRRHRPAPVEPATKPPAPSPTTKQPAPAPTIKSTTKEPTKPETDAVTEGPTDGPTEGPTSGPTDGPSGLPTEKPTKSPTISCPNEIFKLSAAQCPTGISVLCNAGPLPDGAYCVGDEAICVLDDPGECFTPTATGTEQRRKLLESAPIYCVGGMCDTAAPSAGPSATPSAKPSATPSAKPSALPSLKPSSTPTEPMGTCVPDQGGIIWPPIPCGGCGLMELGPCDDWPRRRKLQESDFSSFLEALEAAAKKL